jgi:hypothetical protein
MNNRTRGVLWKIFLILIVFFLFWTIGAKYISQHEFIHSKIFRSYGINSETNIDYFKLNGVTYPIGAEIDKKCNDTCKLANSLNDIIGYNVALFIYFLSIIFLISAFIRRKK